MNFGFIQCLDEETEIFELSVYGSSISAGCADDGNHPQKSE